MGHGGGFLDELVAELRRVPLGALGGVVDMLRAAAGTSSPVGTSIHARRTADALSAAELAPLVLALPTGRRSKLREMERAVVLHALEACGGNVSAAARLLGLDRKAMERRVARARRG